MFPIAVINLPQCSIRRKRMEQRLCHHNCTSYTFITAVDKSSPLIDWYSLNEDRVTRNKLSSRAEKAAYLSHLKAIRTAALTWPDSDYYLILEDDAMLENKFMSRVAAWLAFGRENSIDIINPSGNNFEANLATSTASSGISWYHRQWWGTWTATGYFISRRYALQVDYLFNQPFYRLLLPYFVSELIARQAKLAVYTDTQYIIEDGYDSSVRDKRSLQGNRNWFEQHNDYSQFLEADGLTVEEMLKLRSIA